MARIINNGWDVDPELILIVVFAWGSATSLGLVQTNILPFVDAGSVILSYAGVTLTLGRLVSIGALLFIFLNRDAPLKQSAVIELWIVYATVGLLIAPPLFPVFENTLAQQPAAFVAFLVQSVGFTIVSYLN